MGTYNPNFPLPVTNPLENQVKVEAVYIKKPLVVETIVTPPEPKPIIRSYRTVQRPTSGNIEIIGTSYEQCVIYAKRVTGINKSLGYAGNTQPEGYEPKVGSIALQRSLGHAVAVESITSDGIIATESNYWRGYITRRYIPYWDIKGYIY